MKLRSTQLARGIIRLWPAVLLLAACAVPAFGEHAPGKPEDPLLSDCPTPGKYGGRMVVGVRNAPKTFNQITANETSTTDVTNRMYSALIFYNNATGKTEPDLAKSWEKSADGRTYTFHLRKGLRFSDGSPLTSADVVFSNSVVYDPKVHPSVAELMKIGGKPFDVSAPDPLTVVYRLPESYALFLTAVGSVYIMPKARLEKALAEGRFESEYGVNTRPADLVSSGPFRLKSYAPNERVTLEPNPHFYMVDQKGLRLPYIDELVYVISGDQNADLLKFESKETDAMDIPRASDYTRLQKGQAGGNFKLYDLGTDLRTNFYWFNLNLKADGKTPYLDPVKYRWFSNPNFRRALAIGVNQQKIIRLAFQGQAVPNWGPSTAGNKEWYDPNAKQYPYDVKRAKEMLAKEGFLDRNKDGWIEDGQGQKVTFTILTNADNNYRQTMCALLKSDFKALGVDLVVSPIDFNLLISKIRESRDYEAVLLGLASGVPPDPALGQNVWKSSGKTHFWYIEQPRPSTPWEAQVDSLVGAMVKVDQYPVRKKIWDRIQEIVTDQCVFTYLPSERGFCVIRNRFGNLRPTVVPHKVLWNVHQIYLK